jgi:hypothetical protein
MVECLDSGREMCRIYNIYNSFSKFVHNFKWVENLQNCGENLTFLLAELVPDQNNSTGIPFIETDYLKF